MSEISESEKTKTQPQLQSSTSYCYELLVIGFGVSFMILLVGIGHIVVGYILPEGGNNLIFIGCAMLSVFVIMFLSSVAVAIMRILFLVENTAKKQ